jgi:hypothetical protein
MQEPGAAATDEKETVFFPFHHVVDEPSVAVFRIMHPIELPPRRHDGGTLNEFDFSSFLIFLSVVYDAGYRACRTVGSPRWLYLHVTT